MSDSLEGRRCLVTGAAGMGGGALCELLLQREACVYGLDRDQPSRSLLALSGLDSQVEFVRGDVCNFSLLNEILDRHKIEIVFHLAAQPIVPLSNQRPWETIDSNIIGTCRILEAVRLARRPPGLVFASSGAYYGVTRDERPILEEQAPLEFANIYAATKVAGDTLVRTYAKVYGIRATTCRFMNAYGPDTHWSRIIPAAVRKLQEGADYDFGDRDDGSTRLDFLMVRDMARAYIAAAQALDSDAVAGEAFNFGSGSPISLRDLTRLISRLYDGREREPIFRGPVRAEPLIKSLDISKARRVLNWSPTTDLTDGLQETIAWYRTHWSRLCD